MERPARRAEGFTLLEILLVVFLVGLLTSTLAANNLGRISSGLQNSTDTLEAELRYASERAVATGETHRLVFDLENQAFRLEHEVDTPPVEAAPTRSGRVDLSPPLPSRESLPVANLRGQWRRLDSDVLIARVRIGTDEFARETVGIVFASDGGADSADIELQSNTGNQRVLTVVPFTGEVEIAEGNV